MAPNPDAGPALSKDEIISNLIEETQRLHLTVNQLQKQIKHGESFDTIYAATSYAAEGSEKLKEIPMHGMSARHAKQAISDAHLADFNPKLNTSSYVNVTFEDEERDVAAMGAEVNIADASVYPASILLHNTCVNMIARLWNAPEPKDGGDFAGAGTVGSTEACLLAGLALKFRWRKWYAAKHGLTDDQVLGIRPNLVISAAYQAAWEKLFKYFDIEPKLVKTNLIDDKMAVKAKDLVALCDEKTIAVVGILGNHYNGNYDPLWEINDEVEALNAEKGWQIGVHVDAASGGFIAPFQEMSGKPTPRPWDFRLKNVLTISASGHKFGESICGTGWIVFRHREDLAEHIAVTVTYLGGRSDSLTLNFSRPASGPYVQYYKFTRMGKTGYQHKVENQMAVASYLRNYIASMVHKPSGKKRFEMLDGGDSCCLPVVSARINPELGLHYDDIDMQHALSESHWYVSGYSLGFENPMTHTFEDLFTDVDQETTMFRIVVKSNLTQSMAENLTDKLSKVLLVLDDMDQGYESLHARFEAMQDAKEERESFSFPPIETNETRRESLQKQRAARSTFFREAFKKQQSTKGAMKTTILTQHIC